MSFTQKALGTQTGINITNIVLMLISAVLACIIPFKLFLFVYAVLGPLHYLTEISWLDKRSFFIKQKWHIWPYALASVLFTIALFNEKSALRFYLTSLMISLVVYTLSLVISQRYWLSFILAMVVLMTSLFTHADRVLFLILGFSVFLPTIFHVFLFTGFFVLQGALKNKSISGYISFIVFIGCAVSFIFIHIPNNEILSLSERGYIQKYFIVLNRSLADVFGIDFANNNNNFFESPALIAIQRFIGFAYAYHYLNWFSKTTVIKWHDVSKGRLALIFFLWVLSVVCYYVDYRLGFMVLFLLSMFHVFLELPLNVHSIKGIGVELKNIFSFK